MAQHSPLFQHEGEHTSSALSPPLVGDFGHYPPTKSAAPFIGKPSIRAGPPGTVSSLAFAAPLFPCRDRAMGAPEDLGVGAC